MEEARGPSQAQHRGIRKHRDPEDAGDLAQIGHDRSQENWRPGRGWRLPRVHPRESHKTRKRSEVYHRGGVEHDRRQATPKGLQRTERKKKKVIPATPPLPVKGHTNFIDA